MPDHENFSCCEGLAAVRQEVKGQEKWVSGIDAKVDKLCVNTASIATAIDTTTAMMKWLIGVLISATAIIVTVLLKVL